MPAQDETEQLRSSALQTATSVLKIRQQAEQEIRQTNEALKERTQQLAQALIVMGATLEATTEAILVTDEKGAVANFNEKFPALWNIPRSIVEQGSGREIWILASHNFAEPERFVEGIDRILAGEDDIADTLALKDGRKVERSSRVLRIDGRDLGRVWTFRDVTERNAADMAARHLAAIVASSDDGIVGKDLHSIITSWNQGAERIFGYTAEEMIGSSIMRLIPHNSRDEEHEILSRIGRGERVDHFETVRVTKDGRFINVSITVSPIKDASGQVVGASKVVRDITREKKAEAELRKAKEEAEEANRERLQLLDSEREARSQAERASRMKDEFLATLSHELRTPLNAVLGWAQILRHEDVGADELKQGIETIERNARAQAQIIEDLLDMSRIISGKIRLDVQQIELAAVVNDSIETVRAAAKAKGVQLRTMLGPSIGPISGDANRLHQVFWNLLNNAIKFTPRGGMVEARIRRVDSHIEVSVADTGEGITPEFLPLVFDRFQQADASITRRHGGLGLGLAIVKQLVELHGGRVRVSSEGRGKGSTFVVQLPIVAVYAAPAAEEPSSRSTSQEGQPLPVVSLVDLHVLVVDDEPDARELVKRLLTMAGARVSMAGSASAALELIASEWPDLLVCDIGMPGEDGYSLIRRLRSLEMGRSRALPAVALTAYARSEDRTKAIVAGFNNHVAKPVEPGELLAIVASLAGRKG